MKILHVAPSIERAYGGPTQSLAGYIFASGTAGDVVDVAAPLATATEIGNIEQSGARRVETFAGYGKGSTASSPSLVSWVRSSARQYDVIHVHGLFNFISTFAARAAIAAGSPVVIRPFGTLSRYTFTHRRGALKRAWFQRLELPNLMRAAAVHFTTATERDEAEWNDLNLGERAHIVPPPFMTDVETSRSRRKDPVPVVLFLGRLHPVKNLEMLIDAWTEVTHAVPDARLEIAGEGTPAYSRKLKARVRALGLERSVEFRGFLSGAEKKEALASASLLALPSHHENFGMVVIEAIAAGLPVVVSRHVQLQDFIAEHDLGIVAGDSPDSLAECLKSALSDKALQTRTRSLGKSIVSETFSPEVIGKRLSAMYLAAVSSHRDRLSGN